MTTKKIGHQSFATKLVAVFVSLGILFAFPCVAQAVPARDPDALDPSADGVCRSQVFDLLTPDDLPSNGPTGYSSEVFPLADEGGSATDSYVPLVVIAVGFDGQPYDDAHDWNSQIFGGERSVQQYYADMSFGQFTFLPAQETSAFGEGDNTNAADMLDDGVIHVTLDRQKTLGWSIYDDDEADREELEAYSEALEKAGEYIDFESYDSDGDGYIQTSELAICFVTAGKDAAAHAGSFRDPSQYIWPHAWSYSECRMYNPPAMPVVNGVAIDNFVAIAEYLEIGGGSLAQEDIGVLTHELGHYLGLPDLYNTNAYSFGPWGGYAVDYLSLMDNGCYGADLEGNAMPFSLDIWSRVQLGWADPVIWDFDTEENVQIAGSFSVGEIPLAYRIDTPNEGEYYLIENRRFTGWDEGMGRYYPSGLSENGAGEDLGGGLVLWHIDEYTVDDHMASNSVNNDDHHPGVMPLFFEEDEDGSYTTIGDTVDKWEPFFDADGWGKNVALPLYGTMADDTPEDRTLSSDLVLSLESASAPIADFHLHQMNPSVSWELDCSSATLVGLCYVDWQRVELETTTNITSEITKKPSSTEMGIETFTVCFPRYGIEETKNMLTPPLDETAINARDAALSSLMDLITGANATLAQGAYTPESFDALKGAVAAANDLYVDDTTTEDDVAAAKEELLRMWRLLEPVNTYVLDQAEQEEIEKHRQALYDLADLLCETYDTVDPNAYKPAAYAAFAEVVDRAYDVLANEDATTQELFDARTSVVRALTLLKKSGKRISIATAKVTGLKKLTYNGKVRKPKPVVTLGDKRLVEGTDYTLRYANNKVAGRATVTVTGAGDYTGTVRATFTIAKAANRLSVKGRTANVSYARLKKAAQSLDVTRVVTFSNKGAGKLTYAKVSGNANIVVSKTTGKVTVKKGLKKGTYKVKIRIYAAGNANYTSTKKDVTSTIKVV